MNPIRKREGGYQIHMVGERNTLDKRECVKLRLLICKQTQRAGQANRESLLLRSSLYASPRALSCEDARPTAV